MNEDKVFMVGRGQMQTRHDPFHYLPRFLRLEAKVAAKSSAKLRDFIRALSGGATPKAEEQERYYADSTTGIPFVRVQNLSVSGQLQLDDVKYVNYETHNGLLARSQVRADDLLVKITGVGRMAVAAVPPPGFEGNVNQHIARIRTDDRRTSEVLAAWLNTDIAEALAKRRSTGGTRPALDYGALRSIPVIFDESIHYAVKTAYRQHAEALAKASKKVEGIDDYLLGELGINLPPELENTIANRIFIVKHRELEQRFDPAYFSSKFSRIQHALEAMPHIRLRDVALFSSEQWDQGNDFGDKFPYLEISAINTRTGEVTGVDSIPVEDAPSRARMFVRNNDILVSTTRPNRGAIALVGADIQTPLIASTGFSVIRHVDRTKISKEFLLILLRSRSCLLQLEQRSSGGNYPAITQSELGRVLLPSVAPAIQERVVTHVKALHVEAKCLRQQAENELDNAKRRIEAMLLGEVIP